ncbi:MAG: hypothetical protein AAF399_11770 [Bacteroidota bacterium]
MIGLFLIYFIGRAFYNLAHDHDKSRWGYAILGVFSYYVGAFFGGIMLGVVLELSSNMEYDWVAALIALPFGIGACVGLYFILKKSWEKVEVNHEAIIEEIGKEP